MISDLVDEDVVLHSRRQAISALMFGTVALLSKPGQTFAPLIGTWLLSVQTGVNLVSPMLSACAAMAMSVLCHGAYKLCVARWCSGRVPDL